MAVVRSGIPPGRQLFNGSICLTPSVLDLSFGKHRCMYFQELLCRVWVKRIAWLLYAVASLPADSSSMGQYVSHPVCWTCHLVSIDACIFRNCYVGFGLRELHGCCTQWHPSRQTPLQWFNMSHTQSVGLVVWYELTQVFMFVYIIMLSL